MNERIKELAKQVDLLSENDFVKVLLSRSFAELIVSNYAQQLVQANMRNPEYARAMDEHYENKWAHRFGVEE